MFSNNKITELYCLKNKKFIEKIYGKLFGDKGYLSKELFGNLFNDGIHLVTYLKKNMKNVLMPLIDKIHLRKRSIIETINDQLKKYLPSRTLTT